MVSFRVAHLRTSLPRRHVGGALRFSKRRFQQLAAAAAVLLVGLLVLYARTALSAQLAGAAGIKLGVPAYVFPGQPPLVTLESMSPAPGFVILNPGNGDAKFSAAWQAQAAKLRARGITVLGYVHTNYGSRPVSEVETSVNNYLKPASGASYVGGIFFDEMSTSCADEGYYHQLYRYVRSIDPSAFVADNPGVAVNACDLQPDSKVANTFVTFENDVSMYVSKYAGNVVSGTGAYSAGKQYPASTFWHLVYGVSRAQMRQVISLAAARHAGYLYATNVGLPNPWGSVAGYVRLEAQIAATTPPQ
jgi:Spherulation-specific family 4